MHITTDDAQSLQFKTYRKTVLTTARQLTEKDHVSDKGTIQTLEGPADYVPGDWLCVGVKGEVWPVPVATFGDIYEYAEAHPMEGYALYRSKGVKEAVQIFEPFTVTMGSSIHHGEAGDYLARTSTGLHIVNRTIFEETHERV